MTDYFIFMEMLLLCAYVCYNVVIESFSGSLTREFQYLNWHKYGNMPRKREEVHTS